VGGTAPMPVKGVGGSSVKSVAGDPRPLPCARAGIHVWPVAGNPSLVPRGAPTPP